MRSRWPIFTLATAYHAICEGEPPWVALGNFMNEWFDYSITQRSRLVADPIRVSAHANQYLCRWAAFCAAAAEWLCSRDNVARPLWVLDPAFSLAEPWFDSPGADKPHVRERLIKQTPEPFTRRNVFCGNRVFANKYEFAAAHRHPSTNSPSHVSPSGA